MKRVTFTVKWRVARRDASRARRTKGKERPGIAQCRVWSAVLCGAMGLNDCSYSFQL